MSKFIFEGARVALIKFSEALSTVQKWYERNSENIAKYLLAFADLGVWYSAIDKLAENQIIFTDDLGLDFAKEICDSANIDKVVQRYYFDNNQQNMNQLISRCNSAKEILEYKELYVQTLDAYNREYYHLACIGMFSLIDGVLANVSEMATVTSFKKRIQAIENKIGDQVALNEIDRKTLCIYTAMEHIKDSIFGNSSFSEAEPEGINRHWVMHGRTRKKYSKYDFLKLLLWLDAISYMSQLTE